MVRNVRWLYSKLGTEDFSVTGQSTVSGALSGLNSELGNKSNTSHTHNTDTLPVSNNQVNSTSYIPTSALLYSMKDRADGIQSIIAEAKRILDDPNKRYKSKKLGTWSSVSDVDTFLNQYNYANNYEGLSLGNYVTISDGTYNADWEIAGFDMEHNQLAADGTVYDNGYGICLIPANAHPIRATISFDSYSTGIETGYLNSYIYREENTASLSTLSILSRVLGSHIVERNVLLSNAVTSSGSSSYAWTTAYVTLMSVGQLTGTFASHRNKYDDGEADYKLPLFDYENYYSSSAGFGFWTRCISSSAYAYSAWSDGIQTDRCDNSRGHRPFIYIR